VVYFLTVQLIDGFTCYVICYLQVFESLRITAYDLNVDMLDVHAVCHHISSYIFMLW